ncbi:autotransporter outer membrane beta-barrel domain-containing protein [Buttiauxella sp. WJP83]|uniref:autotransporter outer membrane beta-barrel domain-containing protein n=1 Tax=Buttiauxella sp. WJP83 TaxID=2986951 RepID=UPI0022DE05A4|nr:autotransporter outer membrane beta-barrel domain-containing protein [Buttiauxella sp. WJP83]WBM68780.1 autotransporter outer membrane beta-barrel domain-containing protein [Buttiauxella sp. WJP83]
MPNIVRKTSTDRPCTQHSNIIRAKKFTWLGSVFTFLVVTSLTITDAFAGGDGAPSATPGGVGSQVTGGGGGGGGASSGGDGSVTDGKGSNGLGGTAAGLGGDPGMRLTTSQTLSADVAGVNGTNGGRSGQGGGGGGGGSGIMVSGNTSLTLQGAKVTGGAGGVGGPDTFDVGSGGGGAGVVTGGNLLLTGSGATISGGAGGTGGSAGGGGGTGVVMTGGSTKTLTNEGNTIAGGVGGRGKAGGGGGAAVVTNSNVTNLTGGVITGGDGGLLPSASISASGGGGAGILASGNGQNTVSVVNKGVISGGNGGPSFAFGNSGPGGAGEGGAEGGNAANGWLGNGGAGIKGAYLSIINAGAINGGMSGNPLFGGGTQRRANAVEFTGGVNQLELQAGWSFAGNVVGMTGSTNTLVLGGDTTQPQGTGATVFDVTQLAPTGGNGQFQGFSAFQKTGASTWQLTGTTTQVTPWKVSQGTLSISADEALGDVSGVLTLLNNATLATTASISTARDLVLGQGGGNIDVASSTALALAGTVSGPGSLTKSGDGSLTLSGKTGWTGDTRIDGGELVLDGSNGGAQLVSNIIGQDNTALSLRNGATLTGWIDPTDVSIDIASTWNMTADSLVDDVSLAGTINVVAPSTLPMTAGRTLTASNWNGQGGTVVLNTVLGNDASVTDKIVVNGNTSGNTFLKVNNAGGNGAYTLNGIRVVEVKGLSDGTFTKSGRIVGGVYDYSLEKKGADWFLTNLYVAPPETPVTPGQPVAPGTPETPTNPATPKTPDVPGTPVIRPETASYTANLVAANTMFNTRLHDRLGEPQYTDALTGEKKVTSLWLRQVGGHNRWKDTSGQINTQSNRYVIQMGGDIAQWSSDELQRWHLGVMGGYGHNSSNSRSHVTGYHSDGTVSGYSAGAYATWYQNDETKQGMYLDSWAQYSWFDNDVKGQDIQSESYKSSGMTASLEAGYTHKLGEYTGSHGSLNEWFIQPQAQVIWMGVTADDHRESNGTHVSGEGDNNVQTRLGVRTFLKGHNKIDDSKNRTFQPFVEVNWIHNTEKYGTRMDAVSFNQAGAQDVGEIKTGVEGQLNPNLNLWGNVAVQVGDKGYSDTAAMVGVKYSF